MTLKLLQFMHYLEIKMFLVSFQRVFFNYIEPCFKSTVVIKNLSNITNIAFYDIHCCICFYSLSFLYLVYHKNYEHIDDGKIGEADK